MAIEHADRRFADRGFTTLSSQHPKQRYAGLALPLGGENMCDSEIFVAGMCQGANRNIAAIGFSPITVENTARAWQEVLHIERSEASGKCIVAASSAR